MSRKSTGYKKSNLELEPVQGYNHKRNMLSGCTAVYPVLWIRKTKATGGEFPQLWLHCKLDAVIGGTEFWVNQVLPITWRIPILFNSHSKWNQRWRREDNLLDPGVKQPAAKSKGCGVFVKAVRLYCLSQHQEQREGLFSHALLVELPRVNSRRCSPINFNGSLV